MDDLSVEMIGLDDYVFIEMVGFVRYVARSLIEVGMELSKSPKAFAPFQQSPLARSWKSCWETFVWLLRKR